MSSSDQFSSSSDEYIDQEESQSTSSVQYTDQNYSENESSQEQHINASDTEYISWDGNWWDHFFDNFTTKEQITVAAPEILDSDNEIETICIERQIIGIYIS